MIHSPISVTFFGTHAFACTILQALIDDVRFNVHTVITQPDKPVGRKKVMTPPPVKLLAEANNITVIQAESLKNFDTSILSTSDISVVAQYGKLIPEAVIEAPKYKTLNVHTSLLPTYRGASPIQTALMNGDTQTGVTIMQMNRGLDTGPILSQKSIDILPTECYLDLDARLATLAAPLLLDTIPKYIDGSIVPQKQNDAEATLCGQFSREDGAINWTQDAQSIYNQYRGMTPWPGIWTTIEGKRLKLLDISLAENISPIPAGTIQFIDQNIYIGTTTIPLNIQHIQIEGKTAMDAETFIRGNNSLHDSTLGA
ncbi:methionyl-tRNA formyltransferase [Patescibacteria group bacterium]|nr:methionyl-tRNA formyltransferase [Patescibacteria group bacterium]MBU1721465.1 methionyl-tRNA formyltransferase [Patescibacteria group bacterium]MBU1900778.1 methionyl-tRNA formyltransferase [Patescibacteria group bacterium]